MNDTIEKRQEQEKEYLIGLLKNVPIIEHACKKSGVSRATFYRWRKEDSKFATDVIQALEEGSLLVNDIAESKLMSAIQEGNMTALIFWLKHHHQFYKTKIEVTNRFKQMDEPLSTEQEALIAKALELAGIPTIETIKS